MIPDRRSFKIRFERVAFTRANAGEAPDAQQTRPDKKRPPTYVGGP
jgi:hypothetical protein